MSHKPVCYEYFLYIEKEIIAQFWDEDLAMRITRTYGHGVRLKLVKRGMARPTVVSEYGYTSTDEIIFRN